VIESSDANYELEFGNLYMQISLSAIESGNISVNKNLLILFESQPRTESEVV
jgi:hypothetical protein